MVDRETQNRILVIHPGALGDVLLALPAVRALRTAFYDCEIGLLAGRAMAYLLHTCKEVDAAFSLESQALAGLIAGSESMEPGIRRWTTKCALVVAWMNDSDQRLSAALRGIGIPRVIVRSPSICSKAHQTDRFLETIQSVVQSQVVCQKLHLPADVIEQTKSRLVRMGVVEDKPLVLLHPGSGSRHKCSNPSLLSRVAEWCLKKGLTPLVVGGPADEEQVENLLAVCVQRPMILRGLDLLSMAGVLVHGVVFIGHDSGLTHLAAALHIPTLALFGPTKPERWAPWGPYVTVLTGETCRCKEWAEVQQCHEKPCLQIPVEQVIRTCWRMIHSSLESLSSCSQEGVVLESRAAFL